MPPSPNYLDPKTLSELKDLTLRASTVVDGFATGMHRSPYQGHSVEFSQHREYVPGDNVKHIDWKVFARTDKIHLKQFEDETNLCCWLLVDQSQSMKFQSPEGYWSKYEFASCCTIALSWLILNQRDAVSVGLFSTGIGNVSRPSDQRESLNNFVTLLDQQCSDQPTSFKASLGAFANETVKRGIVVVISDCFDDFESIAAGLEALRRRDHQVILLQVMDPAELDFDFSYALELAGMESSETFLVDPIAIKQAYQQVVREQTSQLSDFCLKQNILFEQVSSNQNIAGIVRKVLQRIASVRSKRR